MMQGERREFLVFFYAFGNIPCNKASNPPSYRKRYSTQVKLSSFVILRSFPFTLGIENDTHQKNRRYRLGAVAPKKRVKKNSPLSIINYQLSIINYQLSIINYLVLLLLVREVARLDILYIVRNSLAHDGVQIGIATQETWRKALVNAEHIVYY